MKGKFVIINLENMDFMKDNDGNISFYETMEKACDICGLLEFENVWVMQLMYNHIEPERKPLIEGYINTVQELYSKYGKTYPYATDAIAYYIFYHKSVDNILIKSYSGVYGRNTIVDEYEVSSYMLDNEYSWEENIKDIEDFIKNLSTNDGGILSDYY